jgi:hypothetical protein
MMAYSLSHPNRQLDIDLKKLTILAAACLALVACSNETTSDGSKATVADSELTGNTGQVLSVIQVPGYTYVEVRNNGRDLWLAGNPVEITEGEIISWADAAMMRNFQSKTLDRTFDELMFVSAIYKGADGAPQPAANANSGVVRSTEKAAGYTYIELETDAGQGVWLATPETDMAVGSRVSWQGGSKMTNFTSSSLDKTFDEILFVQGIRVN